MSGGSDDPEGEEVEITKKTPSEDGGGGELSPGLLVSRLLCRG